MLFGTADYAQQQKAALELHRRHSERWGCGFEVLKQDIMGRELFGKLYFVLLTMLRELSKPMEQRQEWLMWVDADSIVANPAISPCLFLPPDELGLEHVYALVTADYNGLNNGIFYLRVHASSIDLLVQIVDYPRAHPNVDLGETYEQQAISNVIRSIETGLKGSPSGIAWMPRRWFNAYDNESGFEARPGHFIVHFPGHLETKKYHLIKWLNRLERNSSLWEMPVEETFYQTAVPTFWGSFMGRKGE